MNYTGPIEIGCGPIETRADLIYYSSLAEDVAIGEMLADYRNIPAVVAHLSQPIQPLTHRIEVTR